jgi:phosphomannomutase
MLGAVFKAYDIRGVYPDPLNENLAWRIGHGSASYLREAAASAGERQPMMRYLVVGRDMRTSSPSLAESLEKGVTAQGGSVIDVGMVDTPFVYFAINRLDCAGGVMVTASHNPPQYNGFKISKRRAKPVGEATGLGEIRQRAAMADPARHTPDPANEGRVEQRDLWDAYKEHVRAFLDLEAIGKRKPKIIIDASNGMAGTSVPRIFGRNGSEIPGLEIGEMNFDNSKGEFKHEPNPLVAANLADLRKRVVKDGADLGVCFDGDADRCVLVDETGEIIGCDHLTAWMAGCFLKQRPGGAVVYDLRASKAVEEEVAKAGGKPIKSRVGHVFMKGLMAEHDAAFGGELSGHFYFRDNFYADSGVIALASALSFFSADGRKLSDIIRPIRRYPQSGEINFENEDKDGALEELTDRFRKVGRIEMLDGVTVDCFNSQGWWANIRKSNTEPLLRLNLEAKDDETLRRKIDEIAPLLGERVEH